MGSVLNKSNKSIDVFKYQNNGKTFHLNLNIGDKWSDVKVSNATLKMTFFESVFNYTNLDNGDGIVQADELNKLNKIFLYIDKFFGNDKSKNNGVLEEDEINSFWKALYNGKINVNKIINDDNNIFNFFGLNLKKSETNVKNKPNKKYWSEGLDRNVKVIKVANNLDPKIYNELVAYGKKLGIKIIQVESGGDSWIEDSSIRRADGKQYVTMYNNINMGTGDFVSEQHNVSKGGGARVNAKGNAFDIQPTIDKSQIYYGTSYLEGGNVLNTISKNGTPSAIVGESSIAYTLKAMNLNNTPENIAKARAQIAEDLGLNLEDVTFIPQYDFHIDMLYHPLSDGEIAIPDFDEAIKILRENKIEGMSDAEKTRRIGKLERLKDKTAKIRKEAEEKLQSNGYKLVKIPCFTTDSHDTTNFMNGVGGTSSKTGRKFFITNSSEYKGLQELIKPYLKKAGIDDIYFVSTGTRYLNIMGGIDCLTQEE